VLVANQIAAGEVVERPASVVKELVENSLDAGARRITVELEQGGIELVRVTDDGGGISQGDLPLAVAPHATSKIASVEDLEHIGTLGFRGEALASIASVSRLSIRSRTADQPGATIVEVEGATVSQPRPAAGPEGTAITVRNLFFNTPARRKFLRTVATEQERCLDVVRHLAMAHADVGFTASCDGRAVLDLPAGQSPRERAVSVLGKELGSQLLEAHADQFDDSRGVALWGLIGRPAIARGTNKHQHIFVNGRAIRDRSIQHAVAEAYRGLIDPSRYPTVVLMLDMSPAGVDVNVHPSKAEVRFRDSSLIHSVVLRAVRSALQGADLTPTMQARSAAPTFGLPGSGLSQPVAMAVSDAIQSLPTGDAAQSVTRFVDYFKRSTPAPAQGLAYDTMREALASPAPGGVIEAKPAPEAQIPTPQPKDRVLQVHNSYLVTQDEQGVVIIDQHALHERVMFEYLLARVWAGGLESQHLLAPAVVPATAQQMDRIAAITPMLEKIGITAAPLGPAALGISAFPSFLFDRGVDPVEFVQELLDKAEGGLFDGAAADHKGVGEQALREALDMMACKAAVKAGDRMSDLELGELVKLRGDVERSSNCPHGRPTSIRLTIKELEKLFGRT